MDSERMGIVIAAYLVKIILFFLLTFIILFVVSKLAGEKDD
jgi:hypothetical protein